MSFNLVTESWIPVLYCNGRYQRVGIRQALTDAGRELSTFLGADVPKQESGMVVI